MEVPAQVVEAAEGRKVAADDVLVGKVHLDRHLIYPFFLIVGGGWGWIPDGSGGLMLVFGGWVELGGGLKDAGG